MQLFVATESPQLQSKTAVAAICVRGGVFYVQGGKEIMDHSGDNKQLILPSSTEEVRNCPMLRQKIGRTTYMVGIHFNENSQETMDDKVLRLMKNDIY